MKAVNIQWDTNDNQELFGSLPSEIEIPETLTDEDEIADYLSDQTGFCHFGYQIEE